jgi:hypothetical protein
MVADGGDAKIDGSGGSVGSSDSGSQSDVPLEVGGTSHVILTNMELSTLENGFTGFKFSVPSPALVTYTVRNGLAAKVNVAIVPKSQWDVFGMSTVAANGNVTYAPYQAYADHQDVMCPVTDSAVVPAGDYALGVACRGDCSISADLSAMY